ncbi:MAG: hypothetical protein AB1938_07380 [Myxococcota bacterium]
MDGPERAGKMKRRQRIWAWALAAPVTLLIVGIIALVIREHSLGERLIEDVNRLSGPRPNAPPEIATDGDYLECVRTLPSVPPIYEELDKDVSAAVQSVRHGAPLASLPSNIRGDLAALENLAAAVLSCARSSTTRIDWTSATHLPPDLKPSGKRAVTLLLRHQLEQGNTGAALHGCCSVVHWARALTETHGPLGADQGRTLLLYLLPVCVDAIDRAAADEKRAFVREVTLARGGYPSFSRVIELDSVISQLGLYSRHLSASQRERLAPGPRAARPWEPDLDWLQRLALRIRWGATVRANDARLAAANSPTRDADFLAITKRFSSPLDFLLPLPLEAPGVDTWARYARLHDGTLAAVDFLLMLARVDLRESGAGDGGWTYVYDDDGNPLTFELHPDPSPSAEN